MKRSSSRLQVKTESFSEDFHDTGSKAKKKKKKYKENVAAPDAEVKQEEAYVYNPAVHESESIWRIVDNPRTKHEKVSENESVTETDSTWERSHAEADDPISKKKKKKKKKSKREELNDEEPIVDLLNEVNPKVETEIEDGIENPNGLVKDAWPKEKVLILLDRLEEALPPGDTLKYTSRVSKINWNVIAFEDYSATDCENMWKRIQEKSRCYRILREIIADAKCSIKQSSSQLYHSLKTGNHPDKPTKPLSSFMLFYMDMKHKIQQENPKTNGAELAKRVGELWKTVNPKKAEKYRSKAQKLRKEYDEKMALFYHDHPECLEENKKRTRKTTSKYGFNKPKSAFQLFVHHFQDSCDGKDANEKQEDLKTQWKNMPEAEKVPWIEAAQREEETYRMNLKKYESEHPGFVPPAVKTLITKNDRHVLENCSGRPKKPPSNAYSLYSVDLLQSDELKNIPAKERLAEVSRRWKALKQSEKDDCTRRLRKLQEEYKKKLSKYLNSLSPQKRVEEEAKLKPSKKKKLSADSTEVLVEPEKPTTDVVELYRLQNQHLWKKSKADSVIHAKKKWEKLTEEQKKPYVQELKRINEEYIENFGRFLQQCPANRVPEYLNIIVKHQQELITKGERNDESEDSEADSVSDA